MKLVGWIACVAAAALVFIGIADGPRDWWDAASLATAEAIADDGTLSIDAAEHRWTAQRVRIDEHFFAATPPVPSLLAALPLVAGAPYRVATAFVSGLPAVLALLLLYRFVRSAGRSSKSECAALVAVCALGSPLLGYGTVLSGVALALAALVAGITARLTARPWTAGLLLGLGVAAQPVAICYLVALAPWRGRDLVRYVAGAAIPLAVHAALVLGSRGTLVGFPNGAFEYGLSFADLGALVVGPDPWVGAWWDTWLGARGALVRFPVAALGAIGLLAAARSRVPLAAPLAAAALALALLGSRPEAVPMGMLAVEHVLLLPALVFGGARLQLNSRPSITIVALALLAASLPSSVLALRSPLQTWHVTQNQTARARLGIARDAAETPIWIAEWERARFVRDPSKTYLSGEFEGRMRTIVTGVLDRTERDPRATAKLRKGLQVVVDRLDRDRSPLFARPLAHFFLGRAQLAEGEPVRAEQSWRTCLELYPRFEEARDALAALGVPVRGR